MVVGMTQMRRRAVIVRQLSALEALGGITDICLDKTGTLTLGQMACRKVWVPNAGTYTVDGSEKAINPTDGRVVFSAEDLGSDNVDHREKQLSDNDECIVDGAKVEGKIGKESTALLKCTALCNLASIQYDQGKDVWHGAGDPTEVALQVLATRFHHDNKTLKEKGWKQLAEHPFDSTIKRMSVVYEHQTSQTKTIFTKGAVERILELCTTIGIDDTQDPLTETSKQN